jgi:hypothetical protein
MGISSRCVEIIADFIKSAVCIQGLDLSRNDLLPNAFEALLEALEKNKTLQMVSLAQNMILDRKDQQEKA